MASKPTIPTQKAGPRQQPPARRRSETRRIVWSAPNSGVGPDTRIFVTIGYADDGLRPVEIFYDEGYRSGSDLEMLVSDICILLSIMMQHEDVQIGTFSKSLSREQDLRTGDNRFSSIIGMLIEELQRPPQWAEALLAGNLKASIKDDVGAKGNCKKKNSADEEGGGP